MIKKLITLIFILLIMAIIVHTGKIDKTDKFCPTLVLGFMLLAAYCVGFFFEKIGLPRITGYILAGLFLGPYFLGFYSKQEVANLGFLNNLALAFIAFFAGAELRYKNLVKKMKSILYLVSISTIVIFIGVTLAVFLISDFFPFMKELDTIARLALSSIFGTIAVARSPSSTIAVINETKAKGDYTDIVLSVCIATDVLILIIYAIDISICEVLIKGAGKIEFLFFIELIFEIFLAFILGFLLGKGIVLLIERIKIEFPVVIVAMGFIVIKFSHYLSDYMKEVSEFSLNLEPILICMVAGYTIQNFSNHGDEFLEKLDKISFPIYIAFFAITGASINMDVLKKAWILGVVIFLVRGSMFYIGSIASGKLSGDKPLIYKNTWLGFLTQAGVSLGLLAEIARRFPEIGIPVQSILIATITLNQIIGPITLKYALRKVGETNE